MTKQDAPTKLTWTEETLRAIDTLKKSITSAPALISADPEQPYLLQTDASDVGLGAVLAQERDGLEHPIAFYSRALNKAERNYTTTEKECLAVVEGVKAFGIYLLGATFSVITDHNALKALHTTVKAGPRVTRWALALQPYDYTVVHRKGTLNGNADGLSRQAWINPLDSSNTKQQVLEGIGDGQEKTAGGGVQQVEKFRPEEGLYSKEGRMLGSPPNSKHKSRKGSHGNL